MTRHNFDTGIDFDISSVLKQLQAETAVRKAGKHKKHILVVDDERTMLKTIKGLLENDYDVTALASGRLAMDFLKQKDADLVLLDYEMPVFSGVDVFNELRENPRTRNIPVIFLTGIDEKEKINKVISLRPNAYLLKPINAERLRSEIEKALDS